MFVVYCHTCKTTNKAYVGFTSTTLEIRWQQHCYDALVAKSHLVFHKAIRKYGIEVWDHEILEELSTIEDAKKAEISWIEQRKTFIGEGHGYNSTRGGDGTIGYVFTLEQRKKVGDAVREHFADPIARQKKIDAHNTLDARARNSAAQKIAQNRPGMKEKKSENFKRVLNEPDIKRKMCESAQRRWSDPEERRKNRERLNDPIVKEKISAASRISVEQHSLDGEFIATYKSMTEASRVTGANVNCIRQCCKKNTKTAGGFVWFYSVNRKDNDI